MYALSPKGGAFALNMNGVTTELTMDRWFMRMWNRWKGTLVDEEGNVQEAPVSEAQRKLIKDSFSEVANTFGLTTREAQQAVERAGMARVGAFQGNFGYSGNQWR